MRCICQYSECVPPRTKPEIAKRQASKSGLCPVSGLPAWDVCILSVMFSGLEFTNYSGQLVGAHQKIDRVSRRHLAELLEPSTNFPRIRDILHFEGKNGPDGIKIKSPAKNEPWHYFDPLSEDSADFMQLLTMHYEGLVRELKSMNYERSAFEAAWLAHAIVDGLTPAHHYPFAEKISELRGGAPNSSRTSYRKKLIFKGKTKRETVKNMVKAYGPRGLYMAHWLYEFGFSAIVKPLRFPDARLTSEDMAEVKKLGYEKYFLKNARDIARLGMFERYLQHGWQSKLARETREVLAPSMIRTVTVIWYLAVDEAETARGEA